MAGVIQKIRDRAWVVLAVIVFSMVIFLAQTALSDLRNLWDGNTMVVGEVGGEKIEYPVFADKVQAAIKNQQAQQAGGVMDEAMRNNLIESLWQQEINKRVLDAEYAKLGMEVPSTDVYRLFVGPNPSPYVQQIPQFQNPATRSFDPERAKLLLKQNKDNPAVKQLEDQVVESRLQEQYFKLVQTGNTVSKEEARRKLLEDGRKLTFEYLAINYGAVPDSAAAPTDADYLNYYEAHKQQYKQEREETIIKYVVLRKDPSAKDTARAVEALNKLKEEFATTKQDSAFAVSNTEEADAANLMALRNYEELDAAAKDLATKSKPGALQGPVLEGNYYKLTKLAEVKTVAAPFVKIRHILIPYGGNTLQDSARAMIQADSILRAIKGDNFRTLVMQHTADDRTRFSGGELGWLRRGMFGPQFDKTLARAVKGTKTVALSPYGAHLVEVTEISTKGVRIASIAKELYAGKQTEAELQRRAMKFANDVTRAEEFDTLAAKQGFDVRTSLPLSSTNMNIPGLQGAGELVRWAMTTKASGLSGVKVLDNAFVVAYVFRKTEKGYQSLDAVRDQIRTQVSNKKKADFVLGKLKTVTGNTLEAYRQAYGSGAYVATAQAIPATSATVPGVGTDPILMGKALRLKKDEMSKPFAGTTGVYVVRMTNVEEGAAPTEDAVKSTREQMASQRGNQIAGRVYNGLKDAAKIEDNRYKFPL